MDDPRLIGIYLAGGKSSRMGTDKLNLPLGNRLLGSLALMEAIESNLQAVVVVTRKGSLLEWYSPLINKEKCHIIEVQETNQSESLIAGLKFAEELKADGVLVFLADQPFVTRNMVNELIGELKEYSFVAFSKNGKGMVPALFSKKLFKNLYGLTGDKGAREILRGESKNSGKLIEISEEWSLFDIDSPEDYEKVSGVSIRK
jgi:molybdenum cofactor cytidylyltransferase